jgi:hypothetical protein
MRRVLPYGLWPSPLEPERMASLLRITDVQWDRSGRVLIWREERSGRGVLVAREGEGAAAGSHGDRIGAGPHRIRRRGFHRRRRPRDLRRRGRSALPASAGPMDSPTPSPRPSGTPPRRPSPRMGAGCSTCIRTARPTSWPWWTRKDAAGPRRSPRARISTCSRPGTPPGPSSPGWNGITRTCPGTAHACAWRAWRAIRLALPPRRSSPGMPPPRSSSPPSPRTAAS